MRRFAIVLLVFIAAGMAMPAPLDACGDKYLSLGRGTRYERSPVARQASAILIYSNPASELSKTIAKLSVEAALLKAGYKPKMVTAADLARTIHGQSWDLILVDNADLNAVTPQLTTAGAPHVVPVLFKPTKTEVKQTLNTYGAVLASPTKSRTFVDAIDDAMFDRESERKAAAKKARH